MYGRKMEATAVKRFTKQTGKYVKHTGAVILKQQPWLCCTLDGLCEDGLLEIKCPHSWEKSVIVDCENKKCTVQYLVYKDNEVAM